MNQQPAPSDKDKLARTGPRKLLACDGAVCGIISVEILARIEKELRAASGKPGLVLADYFDYVAGTQGPRRDHRNARGAGLQHGRSPRILSQERR